MGRLLKSIYNFIVFLLLLMTIGVTIIWVNNLNLLYKWYFYIIWVNIIIFGISAYLYGKKNGIYKVIEILLLILTIVLIVLLLGTFLIYIITSSMF